MVDALQLSGSDRVLEVGTGFGFQTALLSLLAGEVISIERFATLAAAARENLERTGRTGIEVLVGDGWRGVPERAPFDAIVVSAAAAELPAALVEQLGEGGRMVIPLKRGAGDDVVLFAKRSGRLERERLLTPARFVPLVQGAAL